jgi:WD40 repeat protein
VSDIFISYSRKDGEFVSGLEQALRDRGKDVWVDTDDIGPATRWREEIHLGLQSSHGVIFVMSPDSLGSTECAKELAQAVELKKRIVPVLRRQPEGVVPEALAAFNWVYLRADDDFDAGVERLIEALDTDVSWVHAHTRLGVRASEWTAHDRNGAYLLRGSDLSEAEAFLTGSAGKQPEPSALQLEYVAVSRASARRRQRLLFSSVCVALAIAVVLSVIAFLARTAAVASQQQAYSRQLAADAETQLGIDPELGVLLASKAYDVDPTAEAVDVLRQALAASDIRMTVRPTDGVSQAALTPDGRTLVTAGRDDGLVRLWRYPGGARLGVLPGVSAAPGQMSVNPVDGRVLVVDRSSGQARVFAGRHPEFPAGADVTTAVWGAGRFIFTGARDGTVAEWNGTTGARIGDARNTSEPIEEVAVSSAATYGAAITRTGAVLLYDLKAGRVYRLPYACAGGLGRLVFSPDETRLFADGSGCVGSLWNTATQRQVGNLSGFSASSAAFSSPTCASCTPYLVIGGEIPVVVDPRTGAGGLDHQYLGFNGDAATSVAFVSGGVATGGSDGTIRIWDPGNPSSTLATLRADVSSVASVSAAAGGRQIVSVDTGGGAARVWDTGFPHSLATIGAPSGSVGALSADGGLALASDTAGLLGVFDSRTGLELRGLASSRDASAAGSNDAGLADAGRIAYERSPTSVKAWQTSDGHALAPATVPGYLPNLVSPAQASPRLAVMFVPRSGPGGLAEVVDPTRASATIVAHERATALAISADGSVLALAEGRKVSVIELGSGRTIRLAVIGGHDQAWELAFSADGRRLAIGGRDFLDVFSLPDGRLAGMPLSVAGAQLASLGLSRDGRTVAGGYTDLRARVWTVATADLVMTAKEPKQPDSAGAVSAVRISPDRRFLLTSAIPDDTELWDLATGGLLYTFPGPLAGWSNDSQRVLTLGGSTQSWSCDVCTTAQALRRLARARVTRGFTRGERARYLTQ